MMPEREVQRTLEEKCREFKLRPIHSVRAGIIYCFAKTYNKRNLDHEGLVQLGINYLEDMRKVVYDKEGKK